MRKNRTKHEAKRPRLAKRALALCFALIFVCSCLLPAFANSEVGALADPLTMEQQQPTNDPTEGGEDPVLLNEGGTDSTEGNEQHQTADDPTEEPKPAEQEPKADEPKNEEPKTEETKNEGTTESKDSAEQQGNEQTKPEEQSKNEGTTGETKPEEQPKTEETKPEGTTEEPKPEETKPEEPKQPTTNTTGDTIEQGEATYTYRFWPDKIDAFELEAINDDVKSGTSLNDAAQSRAGMVPCTVLTVMTNANLRDYQANVQQPTKSGYEFAGWYTVDGTTEDKFSFEQSLNFEKSKTIDVFAKWNELVTLYATATVDVDATLFGGEAAISLADEYSYEDDRMAAPTKTLTLDVEATNLSSNSELSVSSASSSAIEDYCDSNELVPILTLDITPKDNSGNKTEPQETSTVTISGLSELELPDKLTMVHKKDDGTIETIPAQYSNGTLTFEATSFSTYAVAAAASKWGGGSTNTGSWVYLYAAFEDNKIQGYTPSGSHWANKYWVTIGKLWVENIADISRNRSFDGTHKTTGTNYVNVMTALDKYKNSSDTTKFERFEANKGINIDNIVWNWTETYDGKNVFGLSQGGGASPYVTNANTPTWHLDGYAQGVGAYKINYLEKGTNRALKPSVESVGTAGTVIRAENFKEDPITVGGKTYNCVGRDKEFVTIIEGNTVEINLYYEHEVDLGSLPDSDKPFIMVEKRFSGLTEKSQIPENFAIKVGGSSYGVNADNVTHSQLDTDSNAYVVRWKVEVDDAGEYTVSESGYKKDGFTVTTEINDKPVVDPTIGTLATVKKPELKSWNPTVISEKSQRNFKVEMNGNTNNIFVARLKHAVIVFTQKPLSNAQRDVVTQKLTEPMGKAGVWYDSSKKIYFYSVEEQLESGKNFEIDGATVSYDTSKHEISFSEQSFWTHVATVSYSTTNAENPEVSITNTYTPATLDIQITKNLTTHDSSKKFTFKVTGNGLGNEDKRTLVDENGNNLERVKGFEMTDRKTVTLKNVEAGMHVNVTELDRYDYDVTATNYSTPAVPNNNGEKTFDYEVELQNGKLVLVDTATKTVVSNNHIIVTNTPATTSLTVTKKATKDSVEDITTEFDFTLTLGSNSKGVTWTKGAEHGTIDKTHHEFTLKGGESITFSGINVNDDVTVTETDYTSQHYTTTVDNVVGHEKTIKSATLKQNQERGETVAFVNEYTTPKLESMTIKKVVTGAFGERTKEFAFSVKLENANSTLLEGVTASGATTKENLGHFHFTMNHGKSVTLNQIPVGTTITVTETGADEYETSATGHKDSIKTSGARTFTYTVEEQNGKAVLEAKNSVLGIEVDKTVKDNAIIVTNDFDGTPDTGVLLDTLPYLILLAVAVAGGVLVVVRKRKHRDE